GEQPFLRESQKSSTDLSNSHSPNSKQQLSSLDLVVDSSCLRRMRPAEQYILKGDVINYGIVNRISYQPLIKVPSVQPIAEFTLPPQRGNVLEVERNFLFARNDLTQSELELLMMFDRMAPLLDTVRNQPDFQGKLRRLMDVCRLMVDSRKGLRNELEWEAK